MKTRHSIISDSFSIATSGIETIDLVGIKPISKITILPKITNPNAWTAQGHPDEIINKIEIVDGSDVIFSMKGSAAKALAYYSSKLVPVSSLNYMALEWAMVPIEIYFGRYLWDKQFGLDPTKFHNPQLKITHDIDAAMSGAATGYVTVAADIFDDDSPEFSHYLMSKEHYNLTLVASAVTYIDLPEDFPMRMMMSHCFSDTQAPEYQVTQLKLTEANDNKIIFDEPMEELQQYFQSQFPPWHEKVSGRAAASVLNFWITPAFEQTIIVMDTDDSNKVINMDAASGGQKRLIEGEGVSTWEAIARGWAPHGSLPMDFRGADVEADYWSISAAGGARLKVTAASGPDTTPTWDLITQQLHTY